MAEFRLLLLSVVRRTTSWFIASMIWMGLPANTTIGLLALLQRMGVLRYDPAMTKGNASRLNNRSREMLWKSLRAALLLSACLVIGLCAMAQTENVPAQIVITHVTVINPGASSVRPDSAVVITRDHITSVSGAAGFEAPKNARVIDGRGQYLIPGLWDMHVHSAFGDWFPGGRDIILPLFIANGITGVRDMGGDLPVLMAWRKAVANGKIIGPRMVVSGPMLDGYLANGKLRFPSSIAVSTPHDAIAAVDSLKKQGVDFIKVQSAISRDAYLAAATEAHKQGLPIVGQVPDKVRIREVVEAGQTSIEHLMGIFEGCSTEEDKFI